MNTLIDDPRLQPLIHALATVTAAAPVLHGYAEQFRELEQEKRRAIGEVIGPGLRRMRDGLNAMIEALES